MQEIRNADNKLVCRIDKVSKTVEIVLKNCVTTISFSDKRDPVIKNRYKTK